MRLGGRIAAAVEVLRDIETRRRPVADALKDWGLSHRFAGSGDRSAIGNIVYDVLRKRRSLGWRMDDESPAALVFAAILDSHGQNAPAMVEALAGDRFAPALPLPQVFERFAASDLEMAPPAVQADIPDWLAPEFEASFGAGWIGEVAALSDRPPLDCRVNTLMATRDAVLGELAGFGARPSEIAPAGFRIPPIEGDGRHPNVQVEAGFQKGWFEVQDEGSQIVAALVGAVRGERVLDFCAGAGGKTLALAAAMGDVGEVHAFDADRQRLAPIHERLKRAEVRCVTVHSPRDDLAGLDAAMDRVVVDAPCSGTGSWRRRPDAKWRLSPAALQKRLAEQDGVLDAAARYVRPGGRLVYITCSLLAEENVQRVAAFLSRHADFSAMDASLSWALALPQSPPRYHRRDVGGGTTLTLTPSRTGTDGFFFAALRRL